MADTNQLLQMLSGDPRFGALAALCDEYSEPERLTAIRTLGKPEMAKLYERAAGQPAVALSYLVPADAAPHTSVPWVGKNSLPVASAFTKVFTRVDGSEALVGRNVGAMEWLIGPGYYSCIVRPGSPGEFLVDYTREPEVAPKGWPAVKKNSRGASYLVFHNMHDYLRPVGKNVAIGAAYDGPTGKFKNQYFILARTQATVAS